MAYSIHNMATPGKVKYPAGRMTPASRDVTETGDVMSECREVKHTIPQARLGVTMPAGCSAGRQLETGRTICLHSIYPYQFNYTCSWSILINKKKTFSARHRAS